VILFGGKGGVGKTTIAKAAALHFEQTRKTILFATQEIDAHALYARFLDTHLQSFLEIGDRGTYLDRDELQRFFELSIPGVDELMAWMRIGELAEENPDAILVVDTAPTGHTLRMLASSEHFHQLALALDAMQEKHRAMVRQFTRRDVRDAIDAFIDDFTQRAERRRALLTDPAQSAFVPVTLPEPLVVEQTVRLIGELPLDVPFVVLNRSRGEVPEALGAWPVVHVPEWNAEPLIRPSGTFSPLRRGEGIPASALAPPQRGEGGRRPGEGLQLRRFLFFAGKGGVGKTTCSASVALQLAQRHPDRRYVIISVDPAHSLRDLFTRIEAPANLAVETIDTKAKWRRFRDAFGTKIEEALDAITPAGMSISHDTEAMQRLIEIAPPGADELFAITRLADLASDESLASVIVDTAPTGHFLRLLDLPKEAGEWVREFMRILLRYRELIPAGSLGEELVRASRALKDLEAELHSERTAVIVVTRPERMVLEETKRLIAEVRRRGIAVGGVIANYVTTADGDALAELDSPVIINRREQPPLTADALVALVPIE
jgi:arsenite-transporting ATPase